MFLNKETVPRGYCPLFCESINAIFAPKNSSIEHGRRYMSEGSKCFFIACLMISNRSEKH